MALLESIFKGPQQGDGHLFSSTNVSEARRAQAFLEDRLKRAKKGEFSEVVELTPALAELLLDKNADNRATRETKIAMFATDIKNGMWDLNGEPVIISANGELNDGQHRCHAVVRAGRSIKTFVTFGVTRESRVTVDQGTARTSGDYLGMEGEADPNVAATVSSMVWQYNNMGRISRHGSDLPTKAQIRQTFWDNPGIKASMNALPSGAKNIARSRSVLAFCHYILTKRNKEVADNFIRRLMLGDNLNLSDPIYRCRERMLGNERLRPEEKVELIFNTWNASRRGKRLKQSTKLTGNLPELER